MKRPERSRGPVHCRRDSGAEAIAFVSAHAVGFFECEVAAGETRRQDGPTAVAALGRSVAWLILGRGARSRRLPCLICCPCSRSGPKIFLDGLGATTLRVRGGPRPLRTVPRRTPACSAGRCIGRKRTPPRNCSPTSPSLTNASSAKLRGEPRVDCRFRGPGAPKRACHFGGPGAPETSGTACEAHAAGTGSVLPGEDFG